MNYPFKRERFWVRVDGGWWYFGWSYREWLFWSNIPTKEFIEAWHLKETDRLTMAIWEVPEVEKADVKLC